MAVEPGDLDYVSELDDLSKKVARDELGERNKQDTLLAVQTLRQWVLEQPWLLSPTDIKFLLRFLRAKKFSQLEARKKLENYWLHKTNRPEWFAKRDVDLNFQNWVRMGATFCPLKRDQHNRRVIIYRMGAIDLAAVKELGGFAGFYRTAASIYDWMGLDEYGQVNGVVYILDYSDISLTTFNAISKHDELTDFFHYFEKGMPLRVKAIHIYHAPSFLDLLLTLLRRFLTKKMQDRIQIHGSSLVKIYKDVGYECLPDEYLPDDYEGPGCGSFKDIEDNMLDDMSRPEIRHYLQKISSDDYGVDKEKMPNTGPSLHTSASYRKLNID